MVRGHIVEQTIEQFMREHCLTDTWSGTLLAIAVSGGVDSMVLLHSMASLAMLYGGRVHAIHVNHGIRPEAATEAAFVEEVGRDWGIPVTVQQVNLSDITPQMSRGIEADARALRYAALRNVAQELGTNSVFLAHHADDQLETILWRLVRGTTITGIAGLRPSTNRDGMRWMRPLLPCEKADLRAYAQEHNVPYVDDPSNEDTAFTRNYLRHVVVPHLKKIQPGVAKHATEFAIIAAEEDSYLENQARVWVDHYVVRHGGAYALSVPQLLALARPLQRRVIKIILFYCLGTVTWTRSHLDGIFAILDGENPSAVMHLHQRLTVRREYERIVIGELEVSPQPHDSTWSLYHGSQLVVPTDSTSASWTFRCETWMVNTGTLVKSKYELLIPDLTTVVVKSIHTSERIAPLGMEGTKKVQDIFTDNKVPKHLRSTWPALYSEDQLLWIPGLARSRLQLLNPKQHETGWLITGKPINTA